MEAITSMKIVVVGDSYVGKTTLVEEYTKGYHTPSDHYQATVGVRLANRCTKRRGVDLLINVWDTAGSQQQRLVIRPIYKDCDAVVLLYDITKRETFATLPKWLTELREFSNPSLIFLIGNKNDLTKEREVTEEEGSSFAQENQFDFFMETSVINGTNAKTILDQVADQLLLKCHKLDSVPLPKNPEKTTISVWSIINEYSSPIAAIATGVTNLPTTVAKATIALGGILFVQKLFKKR